MGANRPAKTEPATIIRTRLRSQQREERKGNIEDLPEEGPRFNEGCPKPMVVLNIICIIAVKDALRDWKRTSNLKARIT
jgi:hypothetical protein